MNAPGKDRGIGLRGHEELHWDREQRKRAKKGKKKKKIEPDKDLLDLLDDFFG